MSMSIRRSGRSNKGCNKYLQYLLEEETEVSGQDSVRCPVCKTFDYNYDANEDLHGDMIQCDGCNTWQHVDCMSEGNGMETLLDKDEKYYCERCKRENYVNAQWFKRQHGLEQESLDIKEYECVNRDEYLGESESETEDIKTSRKRRRVYERSVSDKSKVGSQKSNNGSGDNRLRENAQKMLYELFNKYIIPATVEAELYMLPEEQDDEKDVALEKSQELESELYKEYPNHRNYTERVRTIFSNLKDAKNLALKAHVIKGQITVPKLIKMSASELANPDLREFREKIDEQSLTQLVVEQPGRPKWVKTHKGEELIENQQEDGEPEPEIFTAEIVHKQVEPPTDPPERRVAPVVPPSSRIKVKYPELALELSGTTDYIGLSSELIKNPYREALGDGKLVVEGRLSKNKVLKYLSEMQYTRSFLLYRIRADANCNSEFKQVYEFLWENDKILGIKNKRSYEKNIYLIPSIGYDNDLLRSIVVKTGDFSEEPEVPLLFILLVIKPELVK